MCGTAWVALAASTPIEAPCRKGELCNCAPAETRRSKCAAVRAGVPTNPVGTLPRGLQSLRVDAGDGRASRATKCVRDSFAEVRKIPALDTKPRRDGDSRRDPVRGMRSGSGPSRPQVVTAHHRRSVAYRIDSRCEVSANLGLWKVRHARLDSESSGGR